MNLKGLPAAGADQSGAAVVRPSAGSGVTETRQVEVTPEPLTVEVVLRPVLLEAPTVTVTAQTLASDILKVPQPVVVVEGGELSRSIRI